MKRVICILVCAVLLLTGCSAGASKEKYDALVEENELLKEKLEELTGTEFTSTESPEKIDSNELFDYTNAKDNAEFGFLEHARFESFLHNGIFRCGTDFEPGKYFILSLYDADAQYMPAKSPNDLSCIGYRVIYSVDIKKNEYIKVTNGQIMISEALIDENSWKQYGILRVGEDLLPGDYQVERITGEYHTELNYIIGIGGSLQVSTNSPINKNAMVKTFRESEQGYITLEEGQYVAGLNVRIKKVS